MTFEASSFVQSSLVAELDLLPFDEEQRQKVMKALARVSAAESQKSSQDLPGNRKDLT